jgi:hypothetical protein
VKSSIDSFVMHAMTTRSMTVSRSMTTHRAPMQNRKLQQHQRSTTVRTGAVDASIAYAVAQQDVALALCVAAEAANAMENAREGTPGRPSGGFVGGACGALVASFALIQTDNELTTPAGLALACLTTLALGKQYVDRFDATPRNALEWPGPRVFPALGVAFSLFAFLANVEALPRVLSPLAV